MGKVERNLGKCKVKSTKSEVQNRETSTDAAMPGDCGRKKPVKVSKNGGRWSN